MMTACCVKTSLIREMLSMSQRTGVLFCVSSIHYFFCKPELINITYTKKKMWFSICNTFAKNKCSKASIFLNK